MYCEDEYEKTQNDIIWFTAIPCADQTYKSALASNKFESIIASSDYMFRKPNPMLFELALKKAGLNAGDVWFCGNNIKEEA